MTAVAIKFKKNIFTAPHRFNSQTTTIQTENETWTTLRLSGYASKGPCPDQRSVADPSQSLPLVARSAAGTTRSSGRASFLARIKDKTKAAKRSVGSVGSAAKAHLRRGNTTPSATDATVGVVPGGTAGTDGSGAHGGSGGGVEDTVVERPLMGLTYALGSLTDG